MVTTIAQVPIRITTVLKRAPKVRKRKSEEGKAKTAGPAVDADLGLTDNEATILKEAFYPTVKMVAGTKSDPWDPLTLAEVKCIIENAFPNSGYEKGLNENATWTKLVSCCS